MGREERGFRAQEQDAKTTPRTMTTTASFASFATKTRAPRALSRRAARTHRVVRVPAKKPAPKKKKEAEPWVQPTLDPSTPSPIFGGSTGGLLRKAQVEEFYVITWESKKEQIFEMPTGGAAIMRAGHNLLKLARKEQALALLTSLKVKKLTKEGYIWRVYPSGEVEYLHPKDGVVPERVNA